VAEVAVMVIVMRNAEHVMGLEKLRRKIEWQKYKKVSKKNSAWKKQKRLPMN
jgi:hypothetical protein